MHIICAFCITYKGKFLLQFPIQFLLQGVPLFLSVTEHKEQSNLIVTFYFNFVPQSP